MYRNKCEASVLYLSDIVSLGLIAKEISVNGFVVTISSDEKGRKTPYYSISSNSLILMVKDMTLLKALKLFIIKYLEELNYGDFLKINNFCFGCGRGIYENEDACFNQNFDTILKVIEAVINSGIKYKTDEPYVKIVTDWKDINNVKLISDWNPKNLCDMDILAERILDHMENGELYWTGAKIVLNRLKPSKSIPTQLNS
jgi:hypothetical protein